MKTTTLPSKHSVSRSPFSTFVITSFMLACIALAPQARATCQQGCFTNNNTILGDGALQNNTGFDNTAIGAFALGFNTTGTLNTAVGFDALQSNTSGYNNTAIGFTALVSNTSGVFNTAIGSQALDFNTTGGDNTAAGYSALTSNTTGGGNTATGATALFYNTTGSDNTANGAAALELNTVGADNTAIGFNALTANMSGIQNTATGSEALSSNTTGDGNTATGWQALSNNNGNNNTAVGLNALYGNSTGNSNIALGFQAGMNVTGNNNIDIGNTGVTGESGKIRIGTKPAQKATFIAGISGVTVANGVGVIINSQGQLGTVVSSARFKEAVKPMDKASEAILSLQPVTFHYKKELDPEGIPQFGLVAEEVEKVNPDLVARDDHGQPYTVRYEAVNAMLLNEFLKEHRKVEELEKQVAKLTAGLQKVSAQLELSRSAPQTVLNDQ